MKTKAYETPTVKIEGRSGGYTLIEKTQNLQEQKESFLRNGTTPTFYHHEHMKQNPPGKSAEIRFDLLGEAEFILNKVKQHYGNGERFLNHMFGPYISQEQANNILMDYIRENSLQESLNVYWSNNMTCSARMVWSGYRMKLNRPEFRRYALWINGSNENPFLRTKGMLCLLDHEIGTHFLRTYNDGLQPWYSDRGRFGLRNAQALESMCSEEGLAAINTAIRSREPYLWLNALKYYAACKSTEFNFTELFDHLERFLQNPEQRWKMVMRIKKGLENPNDLGGHGGDQCYFEGAVKILRNLDAIDFTVLMSGKICYDEVSRIKRVVRRELIKLPVFMHNMKEYLRKLQKMKVLNGLNLSHPHYPVPNSYFLRQKVIESQKNPVSRKLILHQQVSLTTSPSHHC
ncbi:uncharacterized protein KIAA0895-like isoform X2 [Pomacea canaliculata]|uniref:uncharacterized protein KIAA0895-like isoform X2 n=1 Tax=Pomacea canaliculata TaxID=400727 RepID=UPI000D73B283|nr:uncharacterized protein KIAA0895-like isoform X2 [Pomacea canaliculata]